MKVGAGSCAETAAGSVGGLCQASMNLLHGMLALRLWGSATVAMDMPGRMQCAMTEALSSGERGGLGQYDLASRLPRSSPVGAITQPLKIQELVE